MSDIAVVFDHKFDIKDMFQAETYEDAEQFAKTSIELTFQDFNVEFERCSSRKLTAHINCDVRWTIMRFTPKSRIIRL